MKKLALLLVAAGIIFSITGCKTKPQAKRYDRPLAPGELALRKITDPARLPNFTLACYDLSKVEYAIDRSLNYMSKPSSKQFFPYGDITHDDAVNSLKRFKELLASGQRGAQLHSAILREFDVYESVGCDDEGTVLFTGYYTPIFNGSMTQTERFRYPLYKQPDYLVKSSTGEIKGKRLADGSFVKMPPRAQLETSGELKGEELIWMEDPFEVYIAHVQGSAIIRLEDQKLVTVGYAANNGYDYQSISKKMVDDGKLTASQLSLSAMIAYFKAHQDEVARYTQLNPRFVFFEIRDGSPHGSINEPVTTLRTIATDKSVYPRACLAFFKTVLPRDLGGTVYHDPYEGFALDQDTGGAIRAAGRCDIYMGQGDAAGNVAGQVYKEGRLYYLFLKK
ncbi:MAG: MltA domain-containing protein [Phycisphaerae bacterium]|nr:MltA domain-containing protein [Phycisphaerae bacterium]